MTPTAAARAQHATSNLRDRLKDPSLLKEACYIDGTWVGSPRLRRQQSRNRHRACKGSAAFGR
ncbi:hypothetical protein ACVWZV_001497 [Bradyrhizobium sp. GM5.1]